MGSVSEARDVAKRVYAEFSEKNVTFIAGGIAYNAFISLAPMIVLLFLIVSAAGGGLEQRVVDAASTWLPGPIADVFTELFQGDQSVGGASVIGIVVLIWGTLKIFRGLDTAFSEIYETDDTNSFVDKIKDGLVVFGALVVAVVATVGTSAVFAVLSDTIPFIGLLTPVVLLCGLVVAFFPMYYVFPDADLTPREVLPGVVFAAVGWAALQGLFHVYLTFSDPSAGSFFGGVIVVVTYLYFSGLVLLFGAVINAVVGDHSSGRAGGVGRSAADGNTERKATLDRSKLAAYLWTLRSDLTDYYGETRPERSDSHPDPDGKVELIEQSTDEGDEQRWTVTLRWTAEDESQDPLGGVSEEARERPADD